MHELYIGLDIGGSNVRIVLADSELNILGDVYRVPFKRLNTVEEEIQENICSLIEGILRDKKIDPGSVKAIGVSLAALFDREKGCITYWPNNSRWDRFPLREHLQRRFGIPVLLEDDANSAAVGEFCYGAARGCQSFAYITVSTGIGCGLVLNGSLYTGTHGWAGEMGHIKVQENALPCKCGATGCLQALASGPALLSRAKELAIKYGAAAGSEIDNLKDVVAYASTGEEWALEVFDQAGRYLADVISNMAMLLDLPLVVVGGGVASAGDIIISPVKRALKANLGSRGREIEVRAAQCGDDSGVLGIIALAGEMAKGGKELYRSTGRGGGRAVGKKSGKPGIGIINGPNINMLGIREPHFYGSERWDSIEEKLACLAEENGVDLLFFQSNHEGEIVDFIQKNIDVFSGIVINPAAYTKTGYAILDAIMAVGIPYVEVHLSNIFSRGGWHSESIFAQNAIGHIIGLKGYVYELGLRAMMNYIGIKI